MKKRQLTEPQKEKVVSILVILLGVAVLAGQVAETQSGLLRDVSSVLRMYIDPIQYILGMLILNFILVITVIRKSEKFPNPLFDKLKWYFAILVISDFLILVLRIIQKSNLIPLRGGLVIGLGKTYMMLAAVRGIVELTLTSAAIFILVSGLIKYTPVGGLMQRDYKSAVSSRGHVEKAGRIILWLIAIHWVTAIPVNLSGFTTDRVIYAWSLGLSQLAQAGIIALIYWIVKEHYQRYRTVFFHYLSWYYAMAIFLAGLTFTYSMGYFGILQRYPAGEIELMGGFGQVVFYLTRLVYIPMNYLMYKAIVRYSEPQHDYLD